MNWRPIETAPQDTGEKWKTSGTGHLCCNGIPVAQFIEPVCQDGRYIPQALNLLAGCDLSQVVVVPRALLQVIGVILADVSENGTGPTAILAEQAIVNLRLKGIQ